MRLQLLDIDKYIQNNNLKQVKTNQYYVGRSRNKFNPDGLFSEEIFGRIGSKDRKKTFGYIELNCNIIHPEAYNIVTSYHSDLTKLVKGKGYYSVTPDGKLVPDKDNGGTGIAYFYKIFNKLQLKDLNPEKPDYGKFLSEKNIFIDKILVLPAGIRDIQVSEKTSKTVVQYAEISEIYSKLLRYVQMIPGDVNELAGDMANELIENIQHTSNEINSWLKSRMKGKEGLIRGGMLKKVLDFSARLVIVPDNSLDLGYIGLSWHHVIRLYYPFFANKILKSEEGKFIKPLIQDFLKSDEDINQQNLEYFVDIIYDEPDNVPKQLKDELFKITEQVAEDRVVIYKRDPTEDRDSWISCYIRVDDTSFVTKVNNFDLCRNGGDYDGDTIAVFALLSDEAQEEAKKEMNPKESKGTWIGAGSMGENKFSLEQDAVLAIYSATKN